MDFDGAVIPALLAVLSIFTSGAAGAVSTKPAFAVLSFSKTAGYPHDSSPAGNATIGAPGEQQDCRVDASADVKILNDDKLAK